MTTSVTLLVAALAATALAAPYGGETPRCSRECPVAAAKLSYIPNKTYSYTYSGSSRVQLKGVEGGVTDSKWDSKVMMTWLTPCDVAISIKEHKVDGEAVTDGGNTLETYPLVVAVTDGRLQQVCSHPDDDIWSVNIKKGVASAIQNSLPSLSTTSSGLNLTETDVVGTCPTTYEVQGGGNRVVVKKVKNHRLCQESYHTPAETHVPWLKGPLPIQESRSVCTQEINNGIFSSVTCEDKKLVRPAYGAYKFVEAKQHSELRLVSESAPQPDTISKITHVHLVPRSLRYDYDTPKKEPSLVPELEQTLTHICHHTKERVEADAAEKVEKAVHLMRRVPEQAIQQVYEKVINKQICPDHEKLKSLFLDAVSFVHVSGAVPVIVKELVEGRATEGRAALYTAALYLLPRPNIHAIQALKPLFESKQRNLSMARLAAATMVNTYSRHNPQCYDDAPVRSLAQTLSAKIEQDLSSSSDEETQKEALASLKALANMGVITPEVARSVLRYMDTDTKKTNIRVAAAQAFRLAKCEPSVTQQLVSFALHPGKNTEVRIASYLAAIRCVHQEHLHNIVAKISSEQNTQVRGFILSHLLKLQQSDALHKERLRYMLTNIVIPTDFEYDIRKYSRNIDLSYFAPSLGLGAEVESNLLYAPGSFIPRSLDMNLTAALYGTPMIIGEFGGRLEGLEPIIAQVFGPAGYLNKSSYSKIFQDTIQFLQKNFNEITEELASIRERRSIDFSGLSDMFSRLYGPQSGPVQADVFARFMGQEISFASVAGHLQNLNTEALIEDYMRYVIGMLSTMKSMNMDTARTAQLDLDYSFPTIQGTPLKLKMNATVVAGLKMKTNLNGIFAGQPAPGNILTIVPSLSVKAKGFIGYDAYVAKMGLKMNTNIASSNGVSIKVGAQQGQEVQLELDLPDNMDLITVKSETYLMKGKRGQPETKIMPPSMRDARITQQSCLTGLESVFGLKLCYGVNVPDIFRSNSLPLGAPTRAKISLQKTEPSIRGYKIAIATHSEAQSRRYIVKVSAEGSASTREAEIQVLLKKQAESYNAEVKLRSAAITGQAESTIVISEAHKSFAAAVALRSNNMEISQGIKVELKTSPSESEKKYELTVFSSNSNQFPPESSVFTGEFQQSFTASKLSTDFSANTKNALRQRLPFTFEIGGDLEYQPHYGIFVPKLRKAEFQAGLMGLKVISFIRASGESGRRAQYSSAFRIARRDQDLIDVQADFNLQGTAPIDLSVEISAKAKFGEAEYKMEQLIECQRTRKGVSLKVTRSRDSKKIFEFIYMISSEQQIKYILRMEVPEYIKVAVQATAQGQGQYLVEAAVMKGQQSLLHLQGPITAVNSPHLTKLDTDIKINSRYQLISSVAYEENKQTVAIAVKDQQEPMVTLEWDMKTQPLQGSTLEIKLLLPALIQTQINVHVGRSVIHASTNTLLMPRSTAPRRLKAFTDVNLDNNQWKAEVYWDADGDRSKKVAMDVHVSPDPRQAAAAIIQGDITWKTQTHNVKLEIAAPVLLGIYSGQNGFSLEVTTPARQNWIFKVWIHEQGQSTYSVQVAFRTVTNKEYRLTSDFSWERLTGPYGYEVKSDIRYTAPDGKNRQLSIVAKHQSTSETRTILLAMEVSVPSLDGPLKVKFSTENQAYSYITKFQTNRGGSVTAFSWQLETFPEGGVKTFDISVNMKAILDLLNAVKMITGPTTSVSRIHSEAQYEMTAGYSHNSWTGTSRMTGRITHPTLTKDMQAVAEYTTSGDSRQGSFELDIFPDTADKITASLTSVLMANNTVRIEADLAMQALQVKPKVTVEVAWAAHTAAFELKFQKTPSSQESFKVKAKYDRISERDAVVAFQLVTQERLVVDFSGVVKPKEVPECYGVQVQARATTSPLGNFHVNSTMCKPAFIKLAITKQGSQNTYISRLGLQLPYYAHISVTEADTFLLRERPISMIGVELATPTRVKIDFDYKPQEARIMKDFVLEEIVDRVKEASLSWIRQVYREVEQEAQQHGASFPAPELIKIMEELKNDFRQIYRDLMYEVVWPQLEATVLRILRGPTATTIKNVVYQALSSMAQWQRDWTHYALQPIRAVEEGLEIPVNTITEGVKQTLRWAETGEEPEMVRCLLDQLEQTAIYQLLKSDVTDSIKERYPEQYEAVMEVAARIGASIRHDIVQLKKTVLASPTFTTIINRIMRFNENSLRWTLEWYLSQLVQRFFIVAPEPSTYRVGVQIPLYRPVHSLTQALKLLVQRTPSLTRKVLISSDALTPVPISQILETYYKWMPRNVSSLIPPFNRTAVVTGDTEVLTFDGTVLRVPRSPCEVLLTAVPGVAAIHMSHPQPSAPPQITFQAGHTKATITPHTTVEVNGRQVSGRQTVGDITVEVTPRDVTLTSPLVGVQVMKQEHVVVVNVSGWLFNHTKGLLGSYDGERGNDWMTKSGRNASSLHQLVNSWQEDPGCPTPTIQPVSPSSVPAYRVARCHIMLKMRSRCLLLVKPEPFIRMCYAQASPCHATSAYHAVCSQVFL